MDPKGALYICRKLPLFKILSSGEKTCVKRLLPLLLLFARAAQARETPAMTILWPNDEHPVVRFTFGKFVKMSSAGSLSLYSVDVTAKSLWNKPIPEASFDAFFFAKDNMRIGDGYINLNHLGAGEMVRFSLTFQVTGAQPVTLKIVANRVPNELGPVAPPKKIRLTVYSVPSGAKLKVDGVDAGETPKQVEFALGKHLLQFNREGYNSGSFPVEFGPDDVSGGTVSYELGALAHDTVEMRDGSTLTADVESMDATSVVVRMVGNLQTLDRNQVKRILLAQREPASDAVQK
jgi:hypothetical protein